MAVALKQESLPNGVLLGGEAATNRRLCGCAIELRRVPKGDS
ncbi:hypothetical protein PC116_g34788 [Phytophthora cactorum]|nr:hypothetical protein PC116_g34788 [Phytophthora cactorum]